MNRFLLGAAMCAFLAAPAFAALKVGDTAPDFSAKGSLGGNDFAFTLKDAVKKGPVVVYFYPSAYTRGCDLEAHTFATEKDKFDAAGATIIGVSADSVTRLKQFSADPNYCAGKFPVVSDADLKISGTYNLTAAKARDGMKDINQAAVDHDLIERTTFVVGKNGKILAVLSSNDDKLTPDQHVDKSLAIVAAAK